VAESFYELLKRERINRRHNVSQVDDRANTISYIEQFENHQRQHAFSKYQPSRIYAKQESQPLT